jgi:hypothetical protein
LGPLVGRWATGLVRMIASRSGFADPVLGSQS